MSKIRNVEINLIIENISFSGILFDRIRNSLQRFVIFEDLT